MQNELNKTVTIDNQSRYFLLWLWHDDKLLDSTTYESQSKEAQKTLWIQDIIRRLDPDYKVLEHWITTGRELNSKPNSTIFEKGISILFNLSGLKSEHLGSSYEKATEMNRSQVTSSRVDFPIDVIGWSSSDNSQLVYLGQCVLAGKGNRIIGKIHDISAAAIEVRNILSTHRSKPIIRPLIITNMKKEDLKYDIEEAEKKHVKIVTVEDLSYLLQAIRNSDPLINTMIHSIFKVGEAITETRELENLRS
jgi:hypothetical protein